MTIQIHTAGQPSAPTSLEFERTQVGGTVTKVSGATSVDAFDEVISLDDRIRVVGEFRVVRINHVVGKDGKVVREQVVAPCGDLTLVPWDPADPTDKGIVRARP